MRLLKYHGLGNDFLILLDRQGNQPVDGDMARALCERRRGVGADGLIRITPIDDEGGGAPFPHVAMELYNADGGQAEISGNGLRCVARALADSGWVDGDELVVRTGAGDRRARLGDGTVSVEMGPSDVVVDSRPNGTFVDLGNPHFVVALADPASADLAALVGDLDDVNLHLYSVGPEADELVIRTWERGVGETQACGSGACAVALTARHAGQVGEVVTIHHAGGDATVDLGGPMVVLTGPAVPICEVALP